jgi:hypothetical protein
VPMGVGYGPFKSDRNVKAVTNFRSECRRGLAHLSPDAGIIAGSCARCHHSLAMIAILMLLRRAPRQSPGYLVCAAGSILAA